MVKNSSPLVWLHCAAIIAICLTPGFTRGAAATQSNQTSSVESRSFASALNPLGLVKTARRLVSSGVEMYRQKLNERASASASQGRNEEEVEESIAQIARKVMQPSLFRMVPEDFFGIPREGVLGGIFRFMGVDSSSFGMMVLNVLIFFAEMITSNMLGKDAKGVENTRMIKDNLMEWLVKGENEKVDQVLRDARDAGLPESIISTLQAKTGNQTACIQLLICKMSPFIWGFQRTLTDQLNATSQNGTWAGDARTLLDTNIWDNLFQVFPDKKNFVSFGDNCETRFPNCKLLKFSKNTSSKYKR